MTTLSIDERGVMLTCYFGGTAGAMLIVSVDKNTTVNEVFEELQQEVNDTYGHIEHCANLHEFTGNSDDLDAALKAQLEEMRQHIDTTGNGEKPYDASLDYSFDDDDLGEDLPYAIFTVEFNEEV